METTNNKKKTVKIIFGATFLVALIGVFAFVYVKFSAKPVEGNKEITIEVVDQDEQSTLYEVNTDAEFLRQAMEETRGLTFEGDESEYGLMIYSVNGTVADFNSDGSYWSFYVNDQYCQYGIDTQPVADGDAFAIVYTVGE